MNSKEKARLAQKSNKTRKAGATTERQCGSEKQGKARKAGEVIEKQGKARKEATPKNQLTQQQYQRKKLSKEEIKQV